MFDSVKEYAYSVKEKVKDTVGSYAAKSDIDKILIEATGNENWNIANSKLQILADACNQHDQCHKIVEHLKLKLDSPPFEWRRILKSLHAMEYLLKNGPPRIQNDLKYNMHKINGLQNFTHFEDGSDKGASIRQKCHNIYDLLTDQKKYEEEREQARQYREKFYSKSGGMSSYETSTQSSYGGPGGSAGGSAGYSGSSSGGGYGGYGGYAPKKDETTTLGYVKDSVGGIVSGAGSMVSSGLTYLGGVIKKDSGSGKKTSHMEGFGSDSYHGSSGYQGGVYDPPGERALTQSDSLSGNHDKKWGAPSTTQASTSKALWGQSSKYDEWKPKKNADAKDGDSKQEKEKRTGKKKKAADSSSSSDSEDDKKLRKKKQKDQEINLLELDSKPQQQQQIDFIDFGAPSTNTNQTQKPQQSDNLLDLFGTDTQPSQQQQQQTFPQFNQQQPVSQQQQLQDLLNLNKAQSSSNTNSGVNFIPGIQQQIPSMTNPLNLSQQQQQQPFTYNQSSMQQTVNMFGNMNININNPQPQNRPSNLSQPTQHSHQQQQQQHQQQQHTQDQKNKNPSDAWEMGSGLINLSNLNQGLNMNELDKELSARNSTQYSKPVYINTDIKTMNAQQQNMQNPMFIPNIMQGANSGAVPNMNTQEQMMYMMRMQQQQQTPQNNNQGTAQKTGFQSGLLFNQQNMGNAAMGQQQQQQQRASMGGFNQQTPSQQQQQNNNQFSLF